MFLHLLLKYAPPPCAQFLVVGLSENFPLFHNLLM